MRQRIGREREKNDKKIKVRQGERGRIYIYRERVIEIKRKMRQGERS